jgi:hypothetical protein
MKQINKSATAMQKQQPNKARGKISGVVGMDLGDKSSTILCARGWRRIALTFSWEEGIGGFEG